MYIERESGSVVHHPRRATGHAATPLRCHCSTRLVPRRGRRESAGFCVNKAKQLAPLTETKGRISSGERRRKKDWRGKTGEKRLTMQAGDRKSAADWLVSSQDRKQSRAGGRQKVGMLGENPPPLPNSL